MSKITKLKLIRGIAFFILILGVCFIAFYSNYYVATFLVVFAIFIEWKFLKCPHCKYSLDVRMKISDSFHCPGCGREIRY